MKIRLAQGPDEIRVAQRLRHDVFMAERGATHCSNAIDADRYDDTCAHLLIIEPDEKGVSPYKLADGGLVATSRLIGQKEAEALGGFYSSGEFDLTDLLKTKSNLKFLELGRTCILKHARGTAVMELLWQGIWNFVRAEGYDVMIGCASFDGTDIFRHADALRFLAKHAHAPDEWRVSPLPNLSVKLPQVPEVARDAKRVMLGLPPLIKGYLRLGCYISDGCVIDHAFNTTDVLIILPVKAINPRYFTRFGQPV